MFSFKKGKKKKEPKKVLKKEDNREFYKPYRVEYKKLRNASMILIIPFLGLGFRYAYLGVIKADTLATIGNGQYVYKENLEDIPYRVYDCNDKNFYESIKKYSIVIDPIAYKKFNTDMEAEAIKTLKYILRNYNKDYLLPDEINKTLNDKITYDIDLETYNKIKEMNNLNFIKGVYIYESTNTDKKNNWDIVNLLTNPLDNKDGSKKPKDTLEAMIADKTKDNIISKIVYEKDVTGKLMEPKYIEGEHNVNLKLTLDKNLQDSIHDMLQDEMYEKYDEVGVVLMEADTGKIRALTQRNYNLPNVNIGATSNHGYFPGSIFKVLVHEMGMEKGITWPTKVYKRNKNIKEFNNKDQLTVREALIWSSNDIFYQIGEEVGFDNIKKIAKQHGMMEKVLGLYHEQAGNFEVDENNLTTDQVRHSAIGQKIRITPLEALSIPSTVINDGYYVKPQIIDSFVDNEGKEIEGYEVEKERIIKKSTASSLKENMKDIVNSATGTGNNAKFDGFDVGGKTGTTEYFEINDKGEREKHCDGWFTGFFNYNDKNYVMVVFVQDIKWDTEYPEEGGTTAAPVFHKVLDLMKENKYLK